ncbi:MAG: hypothetical protein GXO28_02145 [Methanopyri archaeon]|nr:hypothetical protein [Methanopyri archaeon]
MNVPKEVERAARAALRAVERSEKPAEVTGIGADGTPTMRLDEAAERAFIRTLEDEDLPARVISEEAGEVLTDERPEITVVLDPIDGSHNAARGIPFYCVSVGVADPDAETLADVENGLVLPATEPRTPSTREGRVFSVYTYGTPETVIPPRGCRIRCLGAVALELHMIGIGNLDGLLDVRGKLRPTDVAGPLAAHDIEFRLTDPDGEELDPSDVPLKPDFRFNLAAARDPETLEDVLDMDTDVGLRTIQRALGTHPEGLDRHGLAGKLGEEAAELAHALGTGDREAVAGEVADVLALALNIANEMNVDALKAVLEKFGDEIR